MSGFGWANSENKPTRSKKEKRSKGRWDVDADQADHIYGTFSRWDRPESSYSHLFMGDADRIASNADPKAVARLKTAQVMVQTFVDALSGEQSNYTVGIDAWAITASTDLKNRVVRLPARTILDPELTDQEAALLMVGFLGHEIGHVRFDNELDKTLRNDTTVIETGLYQQLSVILREARVEAGFSSLFPGYTGLFEPLLRWISRETKDGSTPPQDALGFAVAATRYPFRFDWSNPVQAAERDWWVQWVVKYASAEDYPTHKTALDEAFAHIKSVLNSKPQDQQDGSSQDGQQDGSQDGEGQGTTGSSASESGQASSSNSSAGASAGGGSTGDYSEAAQGKPYSMQSAQGGMTGADLTYAKNQVRRDTWDKKIALRDAASNNEMTWDEYYEKAKELDKAERKAKADLTRNKNAKDKEASSIPSSIEQVESLRNELVKKKSRSKKEKDEITKASDAAMVANYESGLTSEGKPIKAANETPRQDRGGMPVAPDPEAIGIFRSAFMRLRGGNDGRIGGKRSGRLNDRAIYRLADRQDDRVFTRRGAPKTQALRVYLMVDTSGSMAGPAQNQIQSVSKALIEASIGATNLSLEVWGWDNTVAHVWQRGEDPDEVRRLRARGGTNDVAALKFAVERMEKNLRFGEHGLIIMMSDGEGQGSVLLHTVTEQARSKGMSVFGITMGYGLDQTGAYGKDGFVKWQGSVAATALPLAKIITQSWITKDQHRA